MVPTPQSRPGNASAMAAESRKEKVVISGMSGLYPTCRHTKDFDNVLYNKIDSVANSKLRWDFDHPAVPKYHGRGPNLDRFDAQFFKVSNHLAKHMDPMARKLLEHTHRAIYDAGLSPDCFAGRNIGVFIGSSKAEVEKVSVYDPFVSAHSMPGCSKSMFANRISYWLDVKGPSFSVEDACAGSMVALEQAYQAIQRGDCEAAIVGGAHVTLHPQTVMQYGRVIPLCKDGKTKSFDQAADGCSMSDAICVLLLQKAENALRIYAEIAHIKTQFDTFMEGEEGQRISFMRNPESVTNFLQGFYKEANVSPNEVEYIDAFGCGISKVDKTELEVIGEVFCKERSNPLLVGSVMSNIGYTEATTGLSAITKVLLGYQKGLLAANLHCANPRQDIAALRDGRMRIVTEHEHFNRSYAAINNFSITGVNGHVLLRGCYKPQNMTPKPSLPYLVTVAGRMESSVQNVIDDLKSEPINNQALVLLHKIHEEKNFGCLGRGYVILDSNEENKTLCLSDSVEYYDDVKRPLWFVYSGMGSQWAGMGTQLMRIPIFASAVEKCHKALAPKGLDIVHIITSPEKTIFDNILHSFVGIAAIQIGLTDVLREIGIVPDKIIGHSVGELACGYADGCLTAEEMILSAYSRGMVSLETKFIRGSMAAVGIGYQEAVKLCPPEIEVACHNGPESCTISGPSELMKEFVTKLTADGIFAKEVPCSNIAYHSRYIAQAGPKLLEYLSKVIKNPKRRSERWLSTSVPQDRWNEENAQYCSAWYHTNNLLSSVLFEETSRLVPAGAVLVEIAPHGLLQAILKRSLHPDCRHIPLTKRGHPDNALFLLEAVGKLFTQGYNPKVKNLYPNVEFPVAVDTPTLSHLVEWNYSDRWILPLCKPMNREHTSICEFLVSYHDKENSYLRGHEIRGKTLYPYSAVLVAVWDTLAMASGMKKKEMSIQFCDVHFFSQPVLQNKRHLKLRVDIHHGTGEFEVVDDYSKVASGYITELDAGNTELPWKPTDANEDMNLDSGAIYDIFHERDYSYSGEFRNIHESNNSFTEAKLIWNDNWVTIIDGMLQQSDLQRGHNNVSRLSHIHRLSINLNEQCIEKTHQLNDKALISSHVSPVFDSTRCGGILMEKLRFDDSLPISTNGLKLLNPQNTTKGQLVSCAKKVATNNKITLQSDIGDLNSLRWVETSPELTSASDIVVKVEYAGLNVFDVNVSTGVFSSKHGSNTHEYGMDYSGITQTGSRVMGLLRGGAASTHVRAVPGLVWPVPAHWTLEDAATVPLAYAQAFYCFGIKAHLYPGMTIFVHGGTGALGQAVISIALAHQCTIFTTVRDVSKRNFLLRLYPDLTEDVIGNSRDNSFGDLILLATKGHGCDIAISSATGYLKNTTLKCPSYCGITIDTAQAHRRESFIYGMNFMTNQRSYVMVDFFNIFDNENNIKMIQSMMSEGIARGYVRPLSRVTYAAQESARALRLLAASQHRGRVLLRLRDCGVPAQPRLMCSPALHQLIVCNEDSFSFQLVDRLVQRGARNFHLLSNPISPLFYYKREAWRKLGANIETSPRNVKVLNKILDKKFEGIFAICSGNDGDSIVTNLDETSRKLCPALKYFTILSNGKSSICERICVTRSQNKLPGSLLYLLPKTMIEAELAKSVSQGSIMDIVEQALLSRQPILQICLENTAETSLLKKIVDLANINIPVDIKEETTLKELGLNNSYSPVIRAYLQNSYHISIEDEQIPNLSVTLLKQFEQKDLEPDFKENDGLSSFFSHVDTDELLGVSDMIILPTLVKSAKMSDDLIDLSQQYLWIVSGLEGHYERFHTFCERLKMAAVVLQPGDQHPNETVQELAQRYVKVLTAKAGLEKNNNFYLVGYETGIFVAFEMAAILERNGMKGIVFCIGGPPEHILLTLKNKLKDYTTEEELQNGVITHMITQMCDTGVDEIDSCLKEATWQKKAEKASIIIADRSSFSTQYAQSVIETLYCRIKQALTYKMQDYELKSQVVLLNTSDANTIGHKLNPVGVYNLDTPLEHAMSDPRSVAVVNSYLNADLLEIYDTRNQCELLTDPDMFVSKFSNDQEED